MIGHENPSESNTDAENRSDTENPSDSDTRTPSNPWYMSVLIVVNSAMGAGLLAFPKAYDEGGGLTVVIILQLILGLIATGSLITLYYCSDKSKAGNFQETVLACCGPKLYHITSISIAIYCYMCCVTFLIIIGDQWEKVFEAIYPDPVSRQVWYLDRWFILSITSVVIIYPLCLPENIDFLRYPSFIGVLGVVYVGLLIVAEYFTDLPPPGPIKTKPLFWTDVFQALPAIAFGYQCHLTAVPVYASTRNRGRRHVRLLLSISSLFTCFLCYSAIGIFGYLSFGNLVMDDVLLNYRPTPEVIVGLALLAVKTYTTFPILTLVARSAINNEIVNLTQMPDQRWNRLRRRVNLSITSVWFFTSLLLSLFVPGIGMVVKVLGGVAALFFLTIPG